MAYGHWTIKGVYKLVVFLELFILKNLINFCPGLVEYEYWLNGFFALGRVAELNFKGHSSYSNLLGDKYASE
jgi:hypothetical protein